MSKLEIAVFGLGPSAILAAKAAQDFGCRTVDVFSLQPHWTPPGSFWLHWLPDNLANQFEMHPIYVAGVGSAKGYMQLQWGRVMPGVTTSFPKKDYYAYGYDPREVFPAIQPKNTFKLEKPMTDMEMNEVAKMYDIVFQTFPSEHSKTVQPKPIYYYVGDCGDSAGPNRVIYYGTVDSIVLRETYLWNKKYYEFPKGLPLEEIQKSPSISKFKPTKLFDMDPRTKPYVQLTNVPRNIHLIGRWAEWNTKRLSHEAYILATQILEEYNG